MKNIFTTLILGVAIAATGLAQESKSKTEKSDYQKKEASHHSISKEYENELVIKLEMSEEQRIQFKEISKEYRQKIHETKQTLSDDPSEKKAALNAIKDERDKAIQGILSEAQYAHYQEIVAERKAQSKSKQQDQ